MADEGQKAFAEVSGPLLRAIGVAQEEDTASGASFSARGVAPMTLPLLRVTKGVDSSGPSVTDSGIQVRSQDRHDTSELGP